MLHNYQDVSILLVEDDDVDAMTIERALKKLKIANPLYRTKNGVEALALLRGESDESLINKPFMVLLDLNMPVMGGIEFLKHLREDESLEDTVVFVLTTSSADEDRVAAYKEHVAGYIVKSEVKQGFSQVVELLNYYWRIVALPI